MSRDRTDSGVQNYRAGQGVVLVGPSGLAEPVPMEPAPGCCGITVTQIELSDEGVVTALAGVWRASFGTAAAHPGDVVLELLEPRGGPNHPPARPGGTQPSGQAAGEGDSGRVGVRLLVAARDRHTCGRDRAPDTVSGGGSGTPSAAASLPVRRVAGRGLASWLWLGSWPTVGREWPFLVGPLVFIAWHQERHAANRIARPR
jgi:hypothetical protein